MADPARNGDHGGRNGGRPPLPAPGSRVVVLGLGKTGLSCARFLAARGVQVAVTDTRVHPPELPALQEALPEVAVFPGGFSREAVAAADLVVASPGVPLDEPVLEVARARGVEVIGDIELFARATTAPVIAITGANGKSTVTTLVGDMAHAAGCDARVGGNLGTPALDLVGSVEPALYVLELSSFQLERTFSLAPAVATVLNISPDHLDRHAGMAAYAAAKARIFEGDGVMVLNRDDPVVMAMARPGRRTLSFGLGAATGADFGLVERAGAMHLAQGGAALLPVGALRLVGRHNIANALAALALGHAAGLPVAAMVTALRGFAGLAHRMQKVAERGGVTFIDDSKATNIGAALAALEGVEGGVVLIGGGDGKGQDFTTFGAELAHRARAVVLIGRDARRIAEAIGGAIPVHHARGMTEAVQLAYRAALAGDTVLLAPACASTDMFENYAARGDAFAQAAGMLP